MELPCSALGELGHNWFVLHYCSLSSLITHITASSHVISECNAYGLCVTDCGALGRNRNSACCLLSEDRVSGALCRERYGEWRAKLQLSFPQHLSSPSGVRCG